MIISSLICGYNYAVQWIIIRAREDFIFTKDVWIVWIQLVFLSIGAEIDRKVPCCDPHPNALWHLVGNMRWGFVVHEGCRWLQQACSCSCAELQKGPSFFSTLLENFTNLIGWKNTRAPLMEKYESIGIGMNVEIQSKGARRELFWQECRGP